LPARFALTVAPTRQRSRGQLMSAPPVNVFVSSTWTDLQPERSAVVEVLQRMRHTTFVGMEHFGSRPEDPCTASLQELDRCHVYIGIFAGLYGSGVAAEEYYHARAREMPCLLYLKKDATLTLREEDPEKAGRLALLKADLFEHTVSQFTGPSDLALKVLSDLHRWLIDEYLSPRLESASRGESPRREAEELLAAVRDLSSLKAELRLRLKRAGYDLTSLYQLPDPVPDFVGRSEEVAIGSDFLRGESRMVCISGLGGTGKTQLALAIARRVSDQFPDAHLFVPLAGTTATPTTPAEALAACIRAFTGREATQLSRLEELKGRYRSLLRNKRALIVLDDAGTSQLAPLVPPAGSALLITSRNKLVLPGLKTIPLNELAAEEADALLLGIAPRVPVETADRIVSLCGGLPLAVRTAAGVLATTEDLAPELYAEQLRDERTRLERLGEEGAEAGVKASFSMSYALLSPPAAAVFRRLAVFPLSFNAAAEEFVCEDQGHSHLSDLVRRCLVSFEPKSRRYRLHELMRIFAGNLLDGPEHATACQRHSRHYLEVLCSAEQKYLQGEAGVVQALQLVDVEWKNIAAGQSWAASCWSSDRHGAELCASYPEAGWYCLRLRLSGPQQRHWLLDALAAARMIEDRALLCANLGRLGSVHRSLGQTSQAMPLLTEALTMVRQLGDALGEARLLGNLGNTWLELGELPLALESYQQALQVLDRFQGSENPTARKNALRTEYVVLVGSGGVKAAWGDEDGAASVYQRALAIARDLGDRIGEIRILCALGNLSLERRPSESLEHFKRGRDQAREVGDRIGEAKNLFGMSLALMKQGDRNAARELSEQARALGQELGSCEPRSLRENVDYDNNFDRKPRRYQP
jgi:tetratricopeptide (TPR) repeat protein